MKRFKDFMERTLAPRRPPPESVKKSCDRVMRRLQEDLEPTLEVDMETQPFRNPRSVWAWRWTAVAAVVAAVALAVIIPARVFQGAPAVLEDGNGLRSVRYGEIVRGGTLKLTDGSQVEVRSDSEVSLERAQMGVHVRVSKGDVIVKAAQQREGLLEVVTKDVSAAGNVFLVRAEEEGSRVASIRGEVRVQQNTGEHRLQPGEQVKTNPRMTSLAVREEVAWSREAVSHIAFLQQFAAIPPPKPVEQRVAFEEVSVRKRTDIAIEGVRGNNTSGLGCTGSRVEVDPGRFAISDVNLFTLIAMAYGTPGRNCAYFTMTDTLVGGPGWIKSDQFEIQAVIPQGTPAYTGRQFNSGAAPELQAMLQTLLAERFKLAQHRETRDISVYALTLGNAKDAAQFADLAAESYRRSPLLKTLPDGSTPPDGVRVEGGGTIRIIFGRNATISELVPRLGQYLGLPVLDRTGIQGQYNFDIQAENVPDGNPGLQGNDRPLSPGSRTSLISAIRDQLGLKLESTKASVEVLVIDHAERPTEN